MKTKLLLTFSLVFTLIAFSQAPANDDCSNAEPITGDFTTTFLQFSYDNTQSTTSILSSCDNPSNIWLDQWYTFTMPIDGNISITNAYANDSFAIYDACSGNEVQLWFR